MDYSEDYLNARKSGMRAVRKAQASGSYPFLPALDELLGKEGESLSQKNLGIREIPLNLIVGTKTRGRQNSFARNWMPVLELNTEFSRKWDKVLGYQLDSGISDPIKCYEYMKRFYVQEGNKRVSVLNYLNVPSIEAEVIRIMPEVSDEPAVKTYYEFVQFYKLCPAYEIDFTKPGEYKEFVELLGFSDHEPWSQEAVHLTEAAYYRFLKAYHAVYAEGVKGMTPSDGLLVYLSFYTLQSLIDQPMSVLESRVKRLNEEFKSEVNEDNIALEKAPRKENTEKSRGLFSSLFSAPPVYTEAHPLKAAFLYSGNPEESAWINDEEIGRITLNHRLEGRIETVTYNDCSDDESITAAITNAAEHGADVIVTTSPAMMPRTVRASLHYDRIRFLNMSLNLSHRSVRTYYSRMYEVKFLMGIIAASVAENHKVGYLADNPIYGDIANINAFAIGAALIDPNCKVILEWSTIEGTDWHETFRREEVSVISGPDYATFAEDTLEQGLYRLGEDGQVITLANSVFNWGAYYELIFRSILNGTYDDDPSVKKDQATNYWYGLSAGVIDLVLSESVSYYTRKLTELLKAGIIHGEVQPFAGEINTQDGPLQGKGASVLDDVSIIRMNWLNDNVIGNIPKKESLKHETRTVVEVSGVTSEMKKAAKV